jgi:transcription antitermination factor NusG
VADKRLWCSGVEPFFPSITEYRERFGRVRMPVMTPLFPGYLFAAGEREQMFVAGDSLLNGEGIVRIADQDRVRKELDVVKAMMENGLSTLRAGKAKPGDAVEIKSGPMKGLAGVVEKLDAKRGRVWCDVHCLNTSVSIEVDIADLS